MSKQHRTYYYGAFRGQGHNATQAYLMARAADNARNREKIPEPGYPKGDPVTILETRRFRVRSWLEEDTYPDLSWLGEWTWKEGPNTIPRDGRSDIRYNSAFRMDPGAYFRYDPARYEGLSPERAREVMMDDFQMLELYGDGWSSYILVAVVEVRAFGQWVEIGRDTLGGVELWNRYDIPGGTPAHELQRHWVAETMQECAREAIGYARKTLEEDDYCEERVA